MSKMRIHELAKQIEKDSKEIIKVLIDNNVDVKNHMSVISDDSIDLVKKKLVPPKEEELKKSRITKVYNPQNSGVNRPNNKNNMYRNDKPRNNFPKQNSEQNRAEHNKQEHGRTENNKQEVNKPVHNKMEHNRTEHNNIENNKVVNKVEHVKTDNNRSTYNRTDNSKPANNRTDGNKPAFNRTDGNKPAFNRTDGNKPALNRTDGNKPAFNRTDSNKPAHNRTDNNKPVQNGRSDNALSGQQHNKDVNKVNKPAVKSTNHTTTNNNDNNRQQKPPINKQQNNKHNNRNNNTNGHQRYGQQPQQKSQPPVVQKPKEEEIKVLILPEVLTIKELADKLKISPSVLVKKLFLQGKVVTINQEIDFAAAEEILLEFDVIAEKEIKVDVIEELLKEDDEDVKLLKSRPAVVCVMGHVDHGKTSLLDAIRETNVISREAGGITQHIGAYMVEINGEKITFLDTPGHEAFTAMRMRGAQSTDIAILVVAADDGVMPQTVEAINHAKAAGISIIVAINKIDKPSANIDRVKQELTEYELIPEDWGGDTIFVPVSAHTKEGIETLLEMVLLTAEICELKANPNRNGRGLVIEAQLDKGKGPCATVLVQKGTLRVGDHIAAGSCYGKVRAMMDHKGRRLKAAGPSTPVEILGLNAVPNAGEIFVATENDKEARNFAETFISESREKLIEGTKAKMSLDDLFIQIQAGDLKELNIVVKADVQGSVEAVKQSLVKLSNEQVVVKIIHGGVGAINESDVILASASNAIIIGFNVRPDNTAKEIADREKVDLRLYRVIYNAIEDVEAAMKGMLDPVFREKILGHAEVRQIFKASGIGTIAGSYVLDGNFKRDCSVRLTRDNIVIFEGPLASLKRFKDDVKEVKTGYECGFVFEKFNDVKEGDLVEAYEMEEIPR